MKTLLLTTILLGFLSACGGGSDDGGGGENTSNDTPTDNTDNNNSSSNTLDGTWLKACGPMINPEDGYDIVTITISANQYSNNIENYTDGTCSTPFSPAPNVSASGTFTYGTEFTSTDGVTATQVDIFITSSSDPDLFDVRNYDIFYQDNNNLYFGSEIAETPAERPTAINFDRVFVRQ